MKARNVAIIGLGTFGISVARELTRVGDNVLGIDIDPKRVTLICEDIKSAFEADATDAKALSQCALETYDAVLVSIGKNTEANILAAMNVMELGCQQVWVKAQTHTQEKILKAIGVHHVVLPEQRFGAQVAQTIHNPYVEDFMALGDSRYVVFIDAQGNLVGKTLESLKLESSYEIICLGVYSNQTYIAPLKNSHTFTKGDKIMLFGTRVQLRKFSDANR